MEAFVLAATSYYLLVGEQCDWKFCYHLEKRTALEFGVKGWNKVSVG